MTDVKKPTLFSKPSRLALLIGTAGLLGSYSLPAYAQIDEIIVTARKTEENLQDVPVSVTAFTGEFFRDSGLVEFSDISRLTPNFDVREDGVQGSLFSSPTIRGQTALNPQLNADQAVGITVNGAPITRGVNLFSNLFDVEQVEVLKGPQGTLFGKNTTGGAVIVTTTAPKLGVFEAYAEVDIGNFDRNDFEGVFNVPVGDDFALRFGAATQNRDGFGFGVSRTGPADLVGFETGNDFADDDEEFYRISALYEPSEDFSIRLNADYHEVDEQGSIQRVLNDDGIGGVVALATLDDDFFAASDFPNLGVDPFVEAEEVNLNATIKYNFGNILFESITSYRDQEAASGTPFAAAATIVNGQESDIFAQEGRFSGRSLGDKLQWQAGVFYSTEEGTDVDDVAGSGQVTAAENNTIAIFGQGTYNITDRLSFTGGVRYTDETRRLAQIASNTEVTTPEFEAGFDAFSWTANLDYEIIDDVLAYASISRGFRSGAIDDENLNQVVTESTINLEDIIIDPEFVLNYEIGFKADLFNNTLRWNTSGFFSDYSDIQVQVFDQSVVDENLVPISVLTNAGEATIFGLESEVTYAPNENFTLGGTIGLTFAEFDEFLDEVELGVFEDRSDEAIGGPEVQLSAFGRYEKDLTQDIRAGLQINYQFRGDEELLSGADLDVFDDPSQGILDSYSLINSQLDFDIDGIGKGTNIAFYANNLLDNEFDQSGFATVILGFLDLAQRIPGSPRTYGVRVRQSF